MTICREQMQFFADNLNSKSAQVQHSLFHRDVMPKFAQGVQFYHVREGRTEG
jgi:hypothetical protein